MDAGGTVGGVVSVDGPHGRLLLVRRRWLYRLTSGVLVLVVALALVEALTSLPVYGVDDRHVTSGAAGYELDVRYATVSRPAVAAPFDIEVDLQEDQSITGAMLAASTFGFWITLLTWATWRSKRVRTAVEGTPIVLVQDGRPIDAALRLEQMPLDEVLEAARNKGISELSQVRWAILEFSGKISIIKAEAAAEDP